MLAHSDIIIVYTGNSKIRIGIGNDNIVIIYYGYPLCIRNPKKAELAVPVMITYVLKSW